MRSFIFTTRRAPRTGASAAPRPGGRAAEAGDQRRDAPLIGRTSRISATSESPGSGASDRDGPVALLIRRRSISVDEIVLAADLAREAVVRLERDDVAGLDLQHRLEVRPERPDHFVA